MSDNYCNSRYGLVINSRKFPAIAGLCERALVSSVNVRSCVSFYCVAEEVQAANLLEYCSSLISIHWDELLPQDFILMSAQCLYKMLKTKTKHPLHSAVRLRREDVVFLCLVDDDGSVSKNNQLKTFSFSLFAPVFLFGLVSSQSIIRKN